MISPSHVPSQPEIAGHYDHLGEYYREVWGDELHHGYWERGPETVEEAIRHLSDTVVAHAKISQGDQVCDVGSGYGTLAFRLAETKGIQVHGWTLSSRQAAMAENQAAQLEPGVPRPQFHCKDWLQNQLPSSSCHAVLSIESLSHFAEREQFFAEVGRVLKPGGRLVISDWVAPARASTRQKRWLLEPICREGRLAGLASNPSLIEMAQKAGLGTVDSCEIGSHVRKTWRIISSRLVEKVLTKARYRWFLWENLRSDRVFALTIARLLIAYHTGALEYRLLVFQKPSAGSLRDDTSET